MLSRRAISKTATRSRTKRPAAEDLTVADDDLALALCTAIRDGTKHLSSRGACWISLYDANKTLRLSMPDLERAWRWGLSARWLKVDSPDDPMSLSLEHAGWQALQDAE